MWTASIVKGCDAAGALIALIMIGLAYFGDRPMNSVEALVIGLVVGQAGLRATLAAIVLMPR